MKNLFTTLVLLAGLIITSSVHAADLIISRSVLEDKTGVLTIADVAKSSFTPVGPTLSKGYTDSVHWLQLQVRAPSNGSPLVLYIRQPYLNEIRLYEVDMHEPSGWNSRVTGNHYPVFYPYMDHRQQLYEQEQFAEQADTACQRTYDRQHICYDIKCAFTQITA